MKYALKSRSSAAVNVGRVTCATRIASAIVGPWFHRAVATKIGDPDCCRKSRLGPSTPPTPPT